MKIDVSPAYERRITGAFGDAGRRWLASLPALIDACRARWDLHDLEPIAEPSYGWVAFCTSAHGPSVLKLIVPNPEMLTEIAALGAARNRTGPGTNADSSADRPLLCALYEADAEAGATLIERILPGASLLRRPSFDERIRVAGGVFSRLHAHPRAVDERFPAYADQARRAFARFRAGDCRAPWRTAFESAIMEAEAVIGRPWPQDTLLHADLHHDNILDGGNSWRVIDPKGARGPRAWEAARFMLNQYEFADASDRPDQFTRMAREFAVALHVAPEDIACGALLDACVSTCWSLEDSEDDLDAKVGRAVDLVALALRFIRHRDRGAG